MPVLTVATGKLVPDVCGAEGVEAAATYLNDSPVKAGEQREIETAEHLI